MSSENVEVARRWLEALSAGPEEARSRAPEFWDVDVDYYPVRKFPEARACHGLQEFRRFIAGYSEAWTRSAYAIHELIAVGDDRVLTCATLHTEGRGSGMTLEGEIFTCMWLRHGRFFRVEDHLTLRGALHALGLAGESLEAAGLRDSPRDHSR